MAKLYPPHIEGALPAFTNTHIRIPFEHSRAVGINDIWGFRALVKDIQHSEVIDVWDIPKAAINEDVNEIVAAVPVSSLTVGQYYKIQLAYIDLLKQPGYFSDVGILKYIQEPTISISGLNRIGYNTHNYHYELNYHCNDKGEKLYSTEFIIMNLNLNIVVATSGEIIHNTNTDTLTNTATEGYDFLQELDSAYNYSIQAIVKTSSGFETVTPQYQLQQRDNMASVHAWNVNPVLDFENGCINIYSYSLDVSQMSGRFKLVRADESEGYRIWHTLFDSSINSADVNSKKQKLIWRDFTVEQGQNYKYGLFQINSNNSFSTRYESDAIYADFEDMFLFDGERQLKIRFNPGVSSFKTTLQEVKTDTIGGQYPFISRNANTYYKEFPLSGLISHLSDTSGYFNKDIAQIVNLDTNENYNHYYGTNLNSENVAMERKFKMDVLQWLNDGKPKLFRSPTEGNYLVRLLNVSLSPEQQLGRMLHTFSATAYEIDKSDPDTLLKYHLIGDKLLDEIIQFDSSRGQLSYMLNELSGGDDLIELHSELQDVDIVQANFVCGYNAEKNVSVKINDIEQNVYPNKQITNTITSIKKGEPFAPLSTDMVILTFRKALNMDDFNNKINSIYTEGIPCSQSFGFDTDLFGSRIKDFITRIYQLICSPRVQQIIQVVGTLTTSLIQALEKLLKDIVGGSKTFSKLEEFFQEHGINCPCLEPILYVLKNGDSILGIIDFAAKKILTGDAGQILKTVSQAAITFTSKILKNGISKETSEDVFIFGRTVFEDFAPNISHITANVFTCVEMVYKKAVNIIRPLLEGETLTFNETCGGSNSLLALTKSVISATTNVVSNVVSQLTGTESLNPSTTQICNTAYDGLINTLAQGKIIDSITETQINNLNSQTSFENIASTAGQIINTGINTVITNLPAIIDTTKSVVSTVFNVASKMFGGLC